MKYYSIQEVADILKITPEQVFQLTTGESEHVIWPSIHSDKPFESRLRKDKPTTLKLQRINRDVCDGGIKFDASTAELSGTVGVDLGEWDDLGYATVVRMYQNATWYTPLEPFSIHKSQLLVDADSLAHYCEMRGIRCELPSGDDDTAAKEHIAKRRREGATLDQLIVELVDNCHMTYLQAGRSLDLGCSSTKREIDALKQQVGRKYRKFSGK